MIRRSVAVLCLGLIAAAGCRPGQGPARRHRIVMEGMGYDPAVLMVAVGDTVTWIDRDIVAHTATADAWDTGVVAEGDSASVVLVTAGEVAYRCALHPTMQGKVIVR